MAKNDTIDVIEATIKDLPLVDANVMELVSLLNSLDSTFQQIVEKITPEIAAKFLKVANSAFYGVAVRSIDYALRVLGYNGMKQILITSELIDHFSKFSDTEDFSFDDFQKKAHFCAGNSQVLGQMVNYGEPAELFTVSMLHNIGKLIIALYFKNEQKEIKALKKSEDISASEAEEKVLGVDHAKISALILQNFEISQDICDAVRFHHAEDRIIPEKSNFQMELITRESVKISEHFVVPEEMGVFEIDDQLEGIIAEGKEICREKLKTEGNDKHTQEVFSSLLKEASSLVCGRLENLMLKDSSEGSLKESNPE